MISNGSVQEVFLALVSSLWAHELPHTSHLALKLTSFIRLPLHCEFTESKFWGCALEVPSAAQFMASNIMKLNQSKVLLAVWVFDRTAVQKSRAHWAAQPCKILVSGGSRATCRKKRTRNETEAQPSLTPFDCGGAGSRSMWYVDVCCMLPVLWGITMDPPHHQNSRINGRAIPENPCLEMSRKRFTIALHPKFGNILNILEFGWIWGKMSELTFVVGKRDFDGPVFVGTTAVEDDGCRKICREWVRCLRWGKLWWTATNRDANQTNPKTI